MVPVYIALLHTPVVNRKGAIVTTAVTNMDIHDISRSAKTYGMKGYFIVTPIEDQHELVGRILGHWGTDRSKAYHPDRVEAVSLVRLVHTFEEVKAAIRLEHGENPEVVLTDARPIPNALSYAEYKAELASPSRGGSPGSSGSPQGGSQKPVLLVFGTGWGISDVFYPEVHRILAPVYGPGGAEGYNHLSVRSAVAIILDRLFGH